MAAKEQYVGLEAPQNGTGSPPAAGSVPDEWYEADRLTVHLVLARKRRGPAGAIKVSEVTFTDQNQRPFVLFADPEDPAHPWGCSVEKFIAGAILQAEKAAAAE